MSETGGWAAPDPGDRRRDGSPQASENQAGQEGSPVPEPDETPPSGMPQAPPPPPGQYGQQYPHYPQQPMPAAPPPPGAWGPGYGKPGVIPLRPLNLGEILDGAVTSMRRHPGLMFGSSAVIALVNVALSYLLSVFTLDDLRNLSEISRRRDLTPQEQLDQLSPLLSKTLLVSGVSLLITVLTTTFLTGFLTVVIGKAVLGRPITFGEAFAEARRRILPLLGLTLVYVVLVAAGPVVATLLTILIGPFGLLLMLASLVLMAFLYVRYSLGSASLVLEQGKIGTSLSRSAKLVSGSWWRVFGILLLANLITAMIAWVITLPFGFAGGMSSMLSGTPTVPSASDLLLQEVGGLIATTITAPFIAAVTVLLYIDQRMRKEGMDIQLARAAGTAPPSAGPPQQW